MPTMTSTVITGAADEDLGEVHDACGLRIATFTPGTEPQLSLGHDGLRCPA